MKIHSPAASPGSKANVIHPQFPQRINLRVGSISLRGFGPNAGHRFHHALQMALMQGFQQQRELSLHSGLRLDRISIPPLAAGATVEEAARQVASGLLRTLEARDRTSNAKRGESAHA